MPVTLCRFQRMRLPNQNAMYIKPEPKLAEMGTEVPTHQYFSNVKACAAIASAIAFRSIIEHSKNRFKNVNPNSDLGRIVGTFPPPVSADKAFDLDYFDVALMNFMCDEVKCVDARGDPIDAPLPVDNNLTVSIGKALSHAADFLPSAGASAKLSYFRAVLTRQTFNNKKVLAGSFPTFDDKTLISMLDAGNAVMVLFNFYDQKFDRNNKPAVDPNNNPIWEDSDIGHTVVINGYVKDSPRGTLFRVYDPFGVRPNTRELTANRTFISATNGYFQYVQFKQLQAPTFLSEKDVDGKELFIISQFDRRSKYDHPLFMFNPFLNPAQKVSRSARIVLGFASIGLTKDAGLPLCSQIPETELLAENKMVDGMTLINQLRAQSQARQPQLNARKAATKDDKPAKGASPPSIKIPGKK
jgi:hypothetical protein